MERKVPGSAHDIVPVHQDASVAPGRAIAPHGAQLTRAEDAWRGKEDLDVVAVEE